MEYKCNALTFSTKMILIKLLIVYLYIYRVEGKTLLDKVSAMHSMTEDDVAGFIRQLLEILEAMHANNLVHLDLRVCFHT